MSTCGQRLKGNKIHYAHKVGRVAPKNCGGVADQKIEDRGSIDSHVARFFHMTVCHFVRV